MQKKVKHIDQVKRPVVRPCPCVTGHVSCGYTIISHIIGCPINCSYCFLKTFYGKDEIVIYNNDKDILDQVSNYLKNSDRPLRVGTGQYSDSLALPEAIALGKKLIDLFAGQTKHLFELKTKTANIDEFLSLDHRGRTVMAWSLNPQNKVESDEPGSVSLVERIQAAKRCAAAGYPVAFHFDPIFHYDGWENDYREVVDLIFKEIDPEAIAWVSLGALRYKQSRYPEPDRIEIFKKMQEFIRSHYNHAYIYLCMESVDIWDKVGINNQDSNPYSRYFDFTISG
jgi:spore photoproduct lyase